MGHNHSIYLKDGKFFNKKDDRQVPLENGNEEQIAIIKEVQQREAEFKSENGYGVDVEFSIEATIKFQCLCGRKLEKNKDMDSTDEVDLFDGEWMLCKCGKEYQISTIYGYKEAYIKLAE